MLLELPRIGWQDSPRSPGFVPPVKMGQDSPGVRLMQAISGKANNTIRYYDKPPWKDWDTPAFQEAVKMALDTISVRSSLVLILRFGLDGKSGRTLEEVGREFGVTRDRIRQIEARELRRLRNPIGSGWLIPFIRVYNGLDDRTALAREELDNVLNEKDIVKMDVRGKSLTYEFTMRITRPHLAAALKAAHAGSPQLFGRALVASCRMITEISPCPLCDEPAVPGMEWCLEHLGNAMIKRPQAIVICDGCGTRFLRSDSVLSSFSRSHGRTQHMVFHDKLCFYAHAKEVMKFRPHKIRCADTILDRAGKAL